MKACLPSKPMYCSREYQASTRLILQYEKSTSRESSFRFLSRSIPIFPRKEVIVKLGEKKLILIESPFLEEISGMAIVKIIDQGQKMPMMLKLKFIRNKAILDIMNNTRET